MSPTLQKYGVKGQPGQSFPIINEIALGQKLPLIIGQFQCCVQNRSNVYSRAAVIKVALDVQCLDYNVAEVRAGSKQAHRQQISHFDTC